NMPRTSFRACVIVGINNLMQMRARTNRTIAVQIGSSILFERPFGPKADPGGPNRTLHSSPLGSVLIAVLLSVIAAHTRSGPRETDPARRRRLAEPDRVGRGKSDPMFLGRGCR